ncbi:MAG: DNA-directed RNA polymerase delta subunit [Candidatus Carbobacillus altaicus]|uniref:RNAP delta factor n=1 Tax=Candidatus Carbonibacillus altaicus TaxID=2163959 RepID=A0A2R6Y424_9BACL|nr:MAG: DNA-directed RNA polymerase delta subunit [Candidatus Carbobacillus altaicus]
MTTHTTFTDQGRDDRREWALVEIVYALLKEQGTAGEARSYRELFEQAAEIKGLPRERWDDALVKFYTDLNMDGRFVSLSDGLWGLKAWYTTEQYEDDKAYLSLSLDDDEAFFDDLDEYVLDEEDEDLPLVDDEEALEVDEIIDEEEDVLPDEEDALVLPDEDEAILDEAALADEDVDEDATDEA